MKIEVIMIVMIGLTLVSAETATENYKLQIHYNATDPNGDLTSVKVWVANELIDNSDNDIDDCIDDSEESCVLTSSGTDSLAKDCSVALKCPGVYSITIQAQDNEGHTDLKFTTITLTSDYANWEGSTHYYSWAPPAGSMFVYTITNNGTNATSNPFYMRLDATALTDCIGEKFTIKDQNNHEIDYCFENSTDPLTCSASIENWTKNIWVKIPDSLDSGEELKLYASPTENYEAVEDDFNASTLVDLTYYSSCYTSGSWTPPPTEETQGCSIRVRIANLGDCDVEDYQFRVDISDSAIKDCLTSSENSTNPSFIVCYGTECGDDSSEINGYGQTDGLPYCFETENGECTNATSNWSNQNYIWVKIPEIPAHDFVYLTLQRVDDDDPKRVVNGDEMFDFYDDFDGSEIDESKWQVLNAEGWYALENGALKLWGHWNTNPAKNIVSISSFSLPFVVEDRVRAEANGDTDLYLIFNDK
jgi:hypothetical protein